MLQFLSQNLATIVVGAVVLAIVILAILRTRKTAKSGGCGCGCEGCGLSESCHPKSD